MSVNPSECVTKSFPRTLFYPHFGLLAWHPVGVLNKEVLHGLVDFVEGEEKRSQVPFKRYADFDELTELRFRFGDAINVSDRRRQGYLGGQVKTAIFCSRPIGFGLARMYAGLVKGSAIRARAFRERGAAAEWLGVPLEILCPASECFGHSVDGRA